MGVEAQVLTELGWPMAAAEVVRRWMGGTSAAQLAEIAARLGKDAAAEFDRRTTTTLRTAFETDLFLLAAARMGVVPSRCAVVEDSVTRVRAGVAAGMAVFGYAGGLTPEAELVAAGAEPFAHMRELLSAGR